MNTRLRKGSKTTVKDKKCKKVKLSTETRQNNSIGEYVGEIGKSRGFEPSPVTERGAESTVTAPLKQIDDIEITPYIY